MSKLDEIRALGPPEIGRRAERAKDPVKTAKIEKLKKELAELTKPPPEKEHTRDFVRRVRELSGLTQAEFSAKYGFSRRSLEGWERGASKPGKTATRKFHDIEAKLGRD